MSWLAHSPTAASLPLHRTVRAVAGPTTPAIMTACSDACAHRNYEPQSDAATRHMLASAIGMAAGLSFGCVLVGTIVSALFPRFS
jgi:hypothetical protein